MNIDIKKLKEEIRAINDMRRKDCAKLTAELEAIRATYPVWDHEAVARLNAEEREQYRREYWQKVAVGHGEIFALTARFSSARATALYSLRAHLRGKLHITAAWEPQTNAPRIKVTRTMQDQEALIANYVPMFQKQEQAVAA